LNRKQRRASEKQSKQTEQKNPTISQNNYVVKNQELLLSAVNLHQTGKLNEAERIYRRILETEPANPHATHLLGLIAYQVGHFEAAVDLIGAAIELKRNDPAYYSNLGLSLLALGRNEQALGAFDAALAIDPTLLDGHNNRANALYLLERHRDALQAFSVVICLAPDHLQAYYNQGTILHALGRFDEALTHFSRGLAVRPDHVIGYNNRGNTLQELGRLREAAQAYQTALCFDPSFELAQSNLGVALQQLGHHQAAFKFFLTAQRINPNYAEAHINESFNWLLLGHYAAGWPKYEWRRHDNRRVLTSNGIAKPQWQGEDITGRTILLHAEQGYGDSIQFCRYASMVAARGARVIMEVQPALIRLFSGLAGVAHLVAQGDPLPEFDVHCPMMSLPGIFKSDNETIPSAVPYLTAQSELVRQWRAKLPDQGPLVGLVWQGNPNYKRDRTRSIPPHYIMALVKTCEPLGIRFVCLQKENLGISVEPAMINPMPDVNDFVDTAAIIANLDLVISSDTSVLHLAGAMGAPVWLLNSVVGDWRWQVDRPDSPWYPNMQIFRQKTQGDWQDVFAQVADELGRRFKAA
jgi:tetratricopeptide (TPR) repeat protein